MAPRLKPVMAPDRMLATLRLRVDGAPPGKGPWIFGSALWQYARNRQRVPRQQVGKTIGTMSLLEHADLSAPPLHIPDGKGGAFKTELVLKRSKESVEKIQWWHAPDPRPEPHDHPWPFQSTILAGGYTETRYIRFEEGWAISQKTYRKGDVNDLPAGVFHTVDAVLPGTVTHMVTGALVEGHDWGYLINGSLIGESGGLHYVSAKDDPYPNTEFFAQLCTLNPHKRQQ